MLCTEPTVEVGDGKDEKPLTAVWTPYTNLVELVTKSPAGLGSQIEVFSIDSFQRREAHVIVPVMVRCNPHHKVRLE